MKCEKVKKELELIYEGGKPGAEALAHIKACAKCRAEYRAALSVRAALSGTQGVKIPRNFNRGVWDKIGQPAPFSFSSLIKPALAFGAASVAALFIVLLAAPGIKDARHEVALKPDIVNEKKEITAPEQAPAIEKEVLTAKAPELKIPVEEKIAEGVLPGRVPDFTLGAGADNQYYVKQEENKLSSASASKTPEAGVPPLVVKNNIIKPLMAGEMTLVYRVDETCEVSIVVYNRIGEPVKVIYKGLRGPGVYEEKWRGEDKNGAVAGDGMYIVHVKTCLTEQKVKAVVVK